MVRTELAIILRVDGWIARSRIVRCGVSYLGKLTVAREKRGSDGLGAVEPGGGSRFYSLETFKQSGRDDATHIELNMNEFGVIKNAEFG